MLAFVSNMIRARSYVKVVKASGTEVAVASLIYVCACRQGQEFIPVGEFTRGRVN